MKTQNINLFIILCLSILVTACGSNSPVITSATADKVEIKSPPDQFIEAYDLAKKECDKNTKTAHYIQDNTVSLEEIAFDCIGEEVEVAVEESEPVEDATTEIEATEENIESEEATTGSEIETDKETSTDDVIEETEEVSDQ